MKFLKPILVLAVLLNFSCDLDSDNNFYYENNCIDGQGVIVSETRVLTDFNRINSSIYADILLTQGSKEDIIIEAQQNILDEIETTVVNDELRITLNRCVDIPEAVKVYITIPEIQGLTLTGVGGFMAQNDFSLTDFDVTLTGTGDITLQGTANTFDILLTGVGDVNAFNLITEETNVNITGTGDVEVFVNDELNVTITGVGDVLYKGSPVITTNITGLGSVIDAN